MTAALQRAQLLAFITESNAIEGIRRAPTDGELMAHHRLLGKPHLGVEDLNVFVAEVAPGAKLRDKPGMDVRVGAHIPPPGGPDIERGLRELLVDVAVSAATAHAVHVAYELLHPFMDGNGRSGRALWAWQMQHAGEDPFALPFLRRFYYQTLDAAR